MLKIYHSCRCHSLPRDLAGSPKALQSEDKSAATQDTWDEVICTQSDDEDNKRNGTLADILEDFDWRAELKLLEQENKQAEVNFYYKKHILRGSRSSAVAVCTDTPLHCTCDFHLSSPLCRINNSSADLANFSTVSSSCLAWRSTLVQKSTKYVFA